MEAFDLTSERDRLALVERVFVYPDEPHQRKHGPVGYTDYESFRDWLRDEFSYRCVFSLLRETWPQTRFHIDHLIPQKERPDLVCDYDNLILLEARLNLVKGKRRLPDPCKVALGKHLVVCTSGEQMGCIEARDGSKIGDWIIRVLRLDSEDATQIRRDWISILRSVAQTDEQLFRKFIGYPKTCLICARAESRTRENRVWPKARSICSASIAFQIGIEGGRIGISCPLAHPSSASLPHSCIIVVRHHRPPSPWAIAGRGGAHLYRVGFSGHHEMGGGPL